MGLEIATFISQLVATNPVGATDPKSQGDDHLRLLKSVLQATFPALNAAVLSTPAELNAIHGTQWVNLNVGTAAAPAFTFTGDTDTGMYHRAANATSFAAGGALILDIGSSGMDLQAGTLGLPNGNSLTPAMHFTADTDTGVYSAGPNIIAISAGGNAVASFTPTLVNLAFQQAQFADGAVNIPAISFGNDTDTGLYRTAGALRFSVDNSQIMALSSAGISVIPDGSGGAPAISFANDPNTGICRLGSDDIVIVAGGIGVFEAITAASIFIGNTATNFNFGQTNTTVWTVGTLVSAGASAGGGIAPPATVAGFLQWTINGTIRKIPFYAN